MLTAGNKEGIDKKSIAVVVNVDEDRIGAVIGTKHSVIRRIESALKVRVKVKRGKGEVLILSSRENIDNVLKAKMIIEAIANGIPSTYALDALEKADYILEIINIDDYARGKKDLRRIKSRIIGRGGRIKRIIEDELNVNISIRGKKVAILGKYTNVQAAKDAIISICRGSKHGRVLKKIEEFKMIQQLRGL